MELYPAHPPAWFSPFKFGETQERKNSVLNREIGLFGKNESPAILPVMGVQCRDEAVIPKCQSARAGEASRIDHSHLTGGHENHPFDDIGNSVADAFQIVGDPQEVGSAFDRGRIAGHDGHQPVEQLPV